MSENIQEPNDDNMKIEEDEEKSQKEKLLSLKKMRDKKNYEFESSDNEVEHCCIQEKIFKKWMQTLSM